MKVALYCRKSSEDSNKQIQSIENQLEVLREKARREDLHIVKVYSEAKSAKKPRKRKAFNQMVDDLKDGKFQAILCWKLDRLSRNPTEGGVIQQHLLEGTLKEIITYERRYYSSDNSLMMSMELGMATEYSIALAKNVKRGMNYKVSKGIYPNTAPLGYLNVINTNGEKLIENDPERYLAVKKLWELLLTEKLSMADLAKKAAAMGLRTRATNKVREKKISLHGLHCIFSNPFYYGMFRWNKELHHGNHEAMISKEDFDKAQKIISSKKTAPKTNRYVFPLKGFIHCGECGASVTAEYKNKKRADGSLNERIYYRCTHRRKDFNCKQPMLREEDLQAQIIDILDSIEIPEAFLSWVKKWLIEYSKGESERQKALRANQKSQLNKLDQQIERLIELRINEEIEADIFKMKKDSLILEKKSIEKEMSFNTEADDSRIDTTIEVFEFCKKAKRLFETGDHEDKRTVLNALGSQLYLENKKLRIELAKPFTLIQNAVSEKWILDSRFSTLKTRTDSSENTFICELVKNGATDGI
ncbi:MAG: recombinase family protein [bacterium]